MNARRYDLGDLVNLMARLRGPRGCPWDRRQTHGSLLRHLRGETDEVARAIRRRDPDNLCEELGDLLHQILFHAQLGRETGRFDMDDVVDGLGKKIVRRHPHVFGSKRLRTVGEVMTQWDDIKRREKAAKRRRR